jgi:hypothetical protein
LILQGEQLTILTIKYRENRENPEEKENLWDLIVPHDIKVLFGN